MWITIFEEFQWCFKARNLSLTLTFEANSDVVDEYELSRLTEYIDYIQVANTATIDDLIQSGVPTNKIIFQLSLHGYEKLSNSKISFSIENIKGYNEICHTLSKDNWEKSYNGDSCVAKKVYENKHIGWTIQYDCSRSIANKMRQMVKQRLAGVSISYLSTDDFHGKCGTEADTYADFCLTAEENAIIRARNITTFSALRTVNEATAVSLNKINKNISSHWKRKIDF